MAEIAGIRQSVTRARSLLNHTGFMDMSRGLNTEACQHNVNEGRSRTREAASSLVREGNRGAYSELNDSRQWLERHQDHPSYVPPGGRWEARPTASAESVRSGAANRTGSVMGSVRAPANRGPLGLA